MENSNDLVNSTLSFWSLQPVFTGLSLKEVLSFTTMSFSSSNPLDRVKRPHSFGAGHKAVSVASFPASSPIWYGSKQQGAPIACPGCPYRASRGPVSAAATDLACAHTVLAAARA